MPCQTFVYYFNRKNRKKKSNTKFYLFSIFEKNNNEIKCFAKILKCILIKVKSSSLKCVFPILFCYSCFVTVSIFKYKKIK